MRLTPHHRWNVLFTPRPTQLLHLHPPVSSFFFSLFSFPCRLLPSLLRYPSRPSSCLTVHVFKRSFYTQACHGADPVPPPAPTMIPPAFTLLRPLKQVEAGAQKMTTTIPRRDAGAILAEDTTCHAKNHCLPKSNCNSASFMALPHIVGAPLLSSLIGGGMMTESCGKRFGMYTGPSCREFGGGFWASEN